MTPSTDFQAYVQAQGELLSRSSATAPLSYADARQQVTWGLTELERRIARAAAQSIREFNASPAGQALQAMSTVKTLDEVRALAAQALNSLEFVPVRELVQEHAQAQAQDRSFLIRSVSFGIEFSLFIVALGVQGSVGVAVPPHDWANFEEYVVYLTTSALVGEGANEFGGVTLGLSNQQPTDLAGSSWGIQVDLGDSVGIMFEASFSGSDFTGVSFAAGEDGGVSIEIVASETLVWHWDAPRVYQPRTATSNYMIVQSIVCDQTGEVGNDEIYFKFTPDHGLTYNYPTQGRFSLDSGQTWNAGRSIFFENSVLVELFDSDGGNDDPRGSVTYTATNFPYNTTVSQNGGKYQINAVLNPTFPHWPAGHKINTVDKTVSGPAACAFQGKFYYVWRGVSNNKLYISASSDGVSWPAGAPLNDVDYSDYGPSAGDFNGDLFVFWRGGNNGVYWTRSPDGKTPWANGQRIGSGTTNTTPASCVFNGQFYLFWNDVGMNRIVFSIFNTSNQTWSAPQKINDRDATGDRPAPCVFQNKLYVFWRNNGSGSDRDRIFYSRSSSGTANSWPAGVTINANEYTGAAPCVNVYQGNLFVFFLTNNSYRDLLWTASATGTSWPANTPTGVANVQGMPTVANFNNNQCLAWTDSQDYLWTSP